MIDCAYFHSGSLKNIRPIFPKVGIYTRKKYKGADASVPGRRVVRRHLICSELKTGDNPFTCSLILWVCGLSPVLSSEQIKWRHTALLRGINDAKKALLLMYCVSLLSSIISLSQDSLNSVPGKMVPIFPYLLMT